MSDKKLSRSIRKSIRLQKAQIRRENPDSKKQQELVQEIYQKLNKNKKDENKTNS